MKFLVSLVVLIGLMQTANAKCHRQSQLELQKIKTQFVAMLENTAPSKWEADMGYDLVYIKPVKNGRKITIRIDFHGTLSVDYKEVKLNRKLRKRVKKLHKKLFCQKPSQEILLMKELLGII